MPLPPPAPAPGLTDQGNTCTQEPNSHGVWAIMQFEIYSFSQFAYPKC